jgi:4-hydroxy-tetrahydrodipicolinate synthase
MTQLAQACLRGDFESARAIQKRFFALMSVNFVESNPIPVKAALGLMGLLEPVYRLPMVPPSPANLARIEKVLESAGLLERAPIAS